MTGTEVLIDGFTRIHDDVVPALTGLSPDDLAWAPAPGANPMAWLAWHLTRVQDDHVAHVAGTGQVWTTGGWVDRFALPLDPPDIGYGHDADQVASVTAGSDLLLAYFAATHAQTLRVLGGMADADLDRVVDRRWDPPVTAGVRLVSVIADGLQHVGQIAYLRGLVASG
jgi:hypothetical protein